MNKGILDLKRLVLLRQVQRTGTLAAAAKSMSYSSSAVSQQLSRLSSDLGIDLLEHAGRNVFLTPAATMLVERLDGLLALAEQIEAELSAMQPDAYSKLRVGAFQSFASVFAADLLRAVEQRSPKLDVSFRQAEPLEALNDLVARRFDLIIVDDFPGMPALRPPTTSFVLLAKETLRPYLPKGVQATSVGELSRLSWVTEPKGTPTYDLVVAACRNLGFEPMVKFETTDFEMHRQLVEEGAAAGFLPDLFRRRSSVDLEEISHFGEPIVRDIYAVVRRGTEQHASIKIAMATLKELFADPSPVKSN